MGPRLAWFDGPVIRASRWWNGVSRSKPLFGDKSPLPDSTVSLLHVEPDGAHHSLHEPTEVRGVKDLHYITIEARCPICLI